MPKVDFATAGVRTRTFYFALLLSTFSLLESEILFQKGGTNFATYLVLVTWCALFLCAICFPTYTMRPYVLYCSLLSKKKLSTLSKHSVPKVDFATAGVRTCTR